ncbi:MAG: hypothetical protein SCH70_12115 [Candidatus Methanoperedens sp.]|nr:hypothetical protein [Candidatus Methanoperedens sp.]
MTFLDSEKAVSEVIGHIIILGLTVTGISLISLVGIPTIFELQDMIQVRNAEQAVAVMDSRVSAVVLGNSPVQMLDVNLGGGTYTVEENATGRESYLQVNIVTDSGNDFITLPMGKLRYRLGDRIVAYEGGGAWSKYPSGGSVMLSPPEFHYNGVTLTLPVININGSGSIGGKGNAAIKFAKSGNPVIIYPEPGNPNRTNPVNGSGNSSVYVNITSEFYDAWADYARSLGYTEVSEDGANSRVNIRLTVVPKTLGMNTSITDPITFRGLDGSDETPLESWSFRVKPYGNNLDWDIRAKSGNKKLIFWLNGHAKNPGDKVDLYVGYQDDGHMYRKPAETWEGEDKFTLQSDGYVYVDLLNRSINLTYNKKEVGAQSSCNPSGKIGGGNDFNTTGFSWGGESLNETDLYNITQHYIQLMAQDGDILLNKCGPQTPSGDSTMLINYTAHGALTYLHISDNRADVAIS